ncbi:MAG TPA: M4 family metallopeptidase [Steroidobacteraceae bacterium]|nr:M4 family metallopeptidase [Steroidobacteraceae bacterium]
MPMRSMAAVGGIFLGLVTLASAAEREAGPPVVRHVSDVPLPVDADTLDRQYRALSSMPSVTVAYSALGPVRSLEGPTGIVLSSATRNLKAGQNASEVLQKFKDVLLATGGETLKISGNQMSGTGRHRYIAMDQFISGIPVLYGSVSLRFEEGSGLVDSLGANFLPDRGLSRQPKLSEADAAKRVAQLLVESGEAKPGSVETSPPTLAYHGTHPGSTRGRLVWAVPASYGARDGMFWIDAVDGEYVGRDALSKNALQVYTANNAAPPAGSFPDGLTLLFNHPGSSTDQLAMNAYNNLLDSLQAMEVGGSWLQIDPLRLVLHYGTSIEDLARNARYVRTKSVDYLWFGDGWAPLSIGPVGNSRDAVAHELGHDIGRTYFNPAGGAVSDSQSGAIDEAFGDVVAALVDTYKRGGVPNDPVTWTIAEIYTNDPPRGLRSMSNPKSMSFAARDWFPARNLDKDEETRWQNSTIMSHAFKLLANGPTGGFHVRAGQPVLDQGITGTIPSLFVPGLGPDKTRQIFFETFRNTTLRNFPDFPKLKTAAVSAANLLYGAFEADAADRAFRAVGVGHNCSAPPQPPQMEASDSLCPRWVLSWPAVPGATAYHAQANTAALGWANALTIVNGDVTQCMQQVNQYSHARVRACNGCGCSNWSNTVYMWHWAQCP